MVLLGDPGRTMPAFIVTPDQTAGNIQENAPAVVQLQQMHVDTLHRYIETPAGSLTPPIIWLTAL